MQLICSVAFVFALLCFLLYSSAFLFSLLLPGINVALRSKLYFLFFLQTMFSFLWSFTSFPVLSSLVLFLLTNLSYICFSLLVAQCSLCFHPLFLLLLHHVLPLPRFLSWRLCACLTYYQCVLLLPGLELYHAGTWFLQPPSHHFTEWQRHSRQMVISPMVAVGWEGVLLTPGGGRWWCCCWWQGGCQCRAMVTWHGLAQDMMWAQNCEYI